MTKTEIISTAQLSTTSKGIIISAAFQKDVLLRMDNERDIHYSFQRLLKYAEHCSRLQESFYLVKSYRKFKEVKNKTKVGHSEIQTFFIQFCKRSGFSQFISLFRGII